jgi:hypothetical protein
MDINLDKTDSTEIVAIVDRSGSMESIKQDAIGGFNNFLSQQKSLPGNATFTLIKFDDEIKIEYSGVSLMLVKPFNEENFVPRGTTALYDAIGTGISEAAKRGEDRKVVVAILTDGMENASSRYTQSMIKELIGKYEAKGWAFIFLATGFSQFEAEKMASKIGVNSMNSIGVDRDSMHKVFGCAGSSVATYRSTGSIGDSVRGFIKRHF